MKSIFRISRSFRLALTLCLVVAGVIFTAFYTNKPQPLTAAQKMALQYRQDSWSDSVCQFMQVKDEMRSVNWLADQFEGIAAATKHTRPTARVDNTCEIIDVNDDIELASVLTKTLFALPPKQLLDSKLMPGEQLLSLAQLVSTVNAFSNGRPSIYIADEQRQIMGFALTADDARVYLILNFAYDIHAMPFPLGFMNSTKIKIWRTDDKKVREFVTDAPLSIRANTAAIVILD